MLHVQIAIDLGLLFKVGNGRGDAVTIRSNVLLNGDADFCPRCSYSCEPIGFLKQEKDKNKSN